MNKKEYVTREEYKREKKRSGKIIFFTIGIVAIIVIIGSNFIFRDIVDEKLKDVPHRVCHNETEEFTYHYLINGYWNDNNCYEGNLNIMCSEDLMVDSTLKEYNGKTCIYSKKIYKSNLEEPTDENSICLIKRTKEVCEIE